MKRKFKQFHLYQRNEQSPPILTCWTNKRRNNDVWNPGLEPGEVGDFFALISMKSPNFCQKVEVLVALSVFKSVYFFLPIIILFLQCSHKRSLKFDPFRVWCSIFYSKLVNCILFKIIVQHDCFLKDRGSGERNVKIWIDFRKSQIFPHFALKSRERRSSRPVFSMCGEPGNRHKHVARLIQLIGSQCFSLDNWQ